VNLTATAGFAGFAPALATGLLALAASGAAVADQIQEIVVTVRERAESLQQVPGTVSVLTEQQIENSGIQKARDFIALTPGVSIVNAAEVADSQVNIRGINGARDAETNYALIIDGILMTNPAALNREYLNLKQIEILKGPQGALYGRNAAAGAIVISTKKPGNSLGGDVKASAATQGSWYVAGDVGGPVTDTLKWSVDGNYSRSDGFYRNDFYQRGNSVDYSSNFSVAGRLMWDPTDKLSLDWKTRYGEVTAGSITFNSVFHLPPVAGAGFGAAWAENVNEHPFKFNPNIIPFNDQNAFESSLKVNYDLGFADLVGWGLYSNIRNDFGADGTSGAFGFFNNEPNCQQSTAALNAQGFQLGAPQFIGQVPFSAFFVPNGSVFGAYTPTTCDGTQYQVRNQEDYSFEVRLASKSNERLRWLGGFYYLHVDREVGVNLGIDTGNGLIKRLFTTDPLNPTEQLVDDKFKTDVYAVFGQVAFDVTPDIELALALRYDNEDRSVRNNVPITARTQYLDCNGDFNYTGNSPINPGLCLSPGGIPPKSKTFSEIEPKFTARWTATDYLSVFASVGTGFKSGGFNSQGSKATVDTNINSFVSASTFPTVNIADDFKKETSLSFEGGVKGKLLDNRIRTEFAVYHTRVDDMQFFEFFVGPFGLLRVVDNIDKVEITGVEAGVQWSATDWLEFHGGGNWTDSEIKKNSARPDTVGNKSPYTPDWTATGGTSLTWPLNTALNLIVSADFTAIGKTWFHVVQNQSRPTLFGFDGSYGLARRDAYAILNFRAGLEGKNWSAVFFGRNAANENYLEEVIPAPEFGGSFIHAGSRSRFGIEGTYKF
jgi:iron complex outermembrane receptor protein